MHVQNCLALDSQHKLIIIIELSGQILLKMSDVFQHM